MRSVFARHTLLAVSGLAAVSAVTATLPSYWQFELARAACMLSATAGLTILMGYCGQVSAGQGAFMAVGAYTTALLLGERLSLAACLACSAATAGTLGVVVGVACARIRGPYLAGATLALALALPSVTSIGSLRPVLQAENGLTVPVNPPPSVVGLAMSITQWQALIACVATSIMLWLLANLSRSRYGRTLRAVRDEEVAATLSGIRVAQVQLLAFVVAAVSAGLAGGTLAWVTSLASPGAFGVTLSLMLIAAVVIGGLGSLMGAVWGSLLLVLVPIWASEISATFELPVTVENSLPNGVFGLTLILAVLIFPAGIQSGLARVITGCGHRVSQYFPYFVPRDSRSKR